MSSHCFGSQSTPLDEIFGICPYQQTSAELMRLGCLLAVFLPFERGFSVAAVEWDYCQ